ncbi:MAG: RNA methyltransferase [Chloroflexi bacterium]|nr:RNA methyltransferase [Chloroflexota bacterium]
MLLLYDPAAVTADPRARQLLARLQPEEVHPAEARVLTAAAETETPQPLVAAVPIPPPAHRVAGRLVLVLDAIQDPGNLGTICRTAEAAGVETLVLGPTTADPYSPKALRAGLGAQFRLGLIAGESWPAIRELLAGRRIRLAAAGAGEPYFAVDWSAPSALIVGGEAQGAGPAATALAAETVHIPMAPGVESLNVAIATAVILFEARRQWLIENEV